jgi:hypothetical protein
VILQLGAKLLDLNSLIEDTRYLLKMSSNLCFNQEEKSLGKACFKRPNG